MDLLAVLPLQDEQSQWDFQQAAFVRRGLKQSVANPIDLGQQKPRVVLNLQLWDSGKGGLHMNRLTYLQKSLAFVGQTILQLLMTHSL